VWEDTTPPVAFGRLRSEEGSRPFTVTIARESSAISALEQSSALMDGSFGRGTIGCRL
jgi:hypothetical protein